MDVLHWTSTLGINNIYKRDYNRKIFIKLCYISIFYFTWLYQWIFWTYVVTKTDSTNYLFFKSLFINVLVHYLLHIHFLLRIIISHYLFYSYQNSTYLYQISNYQFVPLKSLLNTYFLFWFTKDLAIAQIESYYSY